MSPQVRNRAVPAVFLVAALLAIATGAWWLFLIVVVVVGLGYAFGPKPVGGRDRSARHEARAARRGY